MSKHCKVRLIGCHFSDCFSLLLPIDASPNSSFSPTYLSFSPHFWAVIKILTGLLRNILIAQTFSSNIVFYANFLLALREKWNRILRNNVNIVSHSVLSLF